MGHHKRKAPKSVIKPGAKRRALGTHTDSQVTGCVKQSLSCVDDEDQQFDRYLSARPPIRAAFSPELIEDGELTSACQSWISEPDITKDDETDRVEDDVALHARELAELKTTDPTFYQFLLENDKELLGFGRQQEAEIEEESFRDTMKPLKTDPLRSNRLTLERFRLIRVSAEESKSFRGLSLLLAAYRGVIRSIAAMDDVCDDDSRPDPKQGKKNFKEKPLPDEEKKNRKKLQNVKLFFHVDVDDEEEAFTVFREVVSSVLASIGTLLPIHLALDGKDKENLSGSSKITFPKPQALKRRTQALITNFWIDTNILLQYFYGKSTEAMESLEQNSLSCLSSPLLLRWLVCLPEHARSVFISSVNALWLTARKKQTDNMGGPIAAFLILQRLLELLGQPKFHSVGMKLNNKNEKASMTQIHDMIQEAQQSLISGCYKAFIHLVHKVGYSWRVAAGYQFILNCLVELLSSVHSSTAYRLTFLAIRQLGLVVRNTAVARSQQKLGMKGASAASAARVRSKRLKAAEKELFNWSFLFSARFLVQAIGKIGRQLKPLSFPLSTILTAVTKAELNVSNHAPFVLHCLQLQCDLMNFLEVFIPLGSHLTSIGTALLAHQDKVCRPFAAVVEIDPRSKNQKKRLSNATHIANKNAPSKRPNGIAARTKIVKTPDVDILLRLSDAQLEMSQVAEELTTRWIDICVDHIGLLSRHPSFPEVSAPLVFHLKKLAKCRSEVARKDLKQFLIHCEASVTEVRQKRFSMDSAKDVPEGKLLILDEKNVTLARYRAARLDQRREAFTLKLSSEANSRTDNVENGEVQAEEDPEFADSESETEDAKIQLGLQDNGIEDTVEDFGLDTDSEDEDEEC